LTTTDFFFSDLLRNTGNHAETENSDTQGNAPLGGRRDVRGNYTNNTHRCFRIDKTYIFFFFFFFCVLPVPRRKCVCDRFQFLTV
jgi:hypothetical protein